MGAIDLKMGGIDIEMGAIDLEMGAIDLEMGAINATSRRTSISWESTDRCCQCTNISVFFKAFLHISGLYHANGIELAEI